MSLELYSAYLKIASSPQQTFIDDAQSLRDEQFYNASNVFSIEEELDFGQMNWNNIDVRITDVINSSTGEKIDDDFKKLKFKNIGYELAIGKRYRFNNNVWITIQTNSGAIVRRCNNVLRWMDSNNNTFQEPCIIDYGVTRSILSFDRFISLPEGTIEVTVQGNDIIKSIGVNQRFLFGKPAQAFKVKSIENFSNTNTFDDTHVGLFKFIMDKDTKSSTDDLTYNITNSATMTPVDISW